MQTRNLQVDQLDNKISAYIYLKNVPAPPNGWVRTIRKTLGMTLQQLAEKRGISKQSVHDIEKREKDKSITLKSLQETANALDMDLVYGLVPKDGSLNALIEKKAHELAIQIVSRASQTMTLEDQANSKERIQQAILERTYLLKKEMPKILWD